MQYRRMGEEGLFTNGTGVSMASRFFSLFFFYFLV